MLKGKSIHHCRGKGRGKNFRTYKSKAKAGAAHRAIMVKRKKGNKYTEALSKA